VATYEKRSGSWRVTLRRKGERVSKTFPTKAMAQAWAAEQEQVLAGTAKRSMRQLLENYLEREVPKKLGARWDAIRINSWLGAAGRDGKPSPGKLKWLDETLDVIGADHISTWRDGRLKTVGPGSVLREMNLMSAIFETARREWRWTAVNPMADVRRPRSPEHRRRRISQDEVDAVCLAAGWTGEAVETKTQEVAAAFLLAIETAMRQAEILRLTWETVDLNRRVAFLPKTKNGSAREVPLSTRAMEIIELMRGRSESSIWTVSSASADQLFRKCKARAGVAGFTFHDSRCEGTSRLAKKVDVMTLARITGHKDLRMLMVYYQTDMGEVAAQLG